MGARGKTVEAIKGFDMELSCRGFKFEVGKEYTATGKIVPCENGFHACPVETGDPLHVFQFYPPGWSRYCLVDQGGEIVPHDDDKAASSTIFIRKEISVSEVVERAVQYRLAKVKGKAKRNSAYGGAASNSGTCGAASNSGYCGAASNSGDYGAASNSGIRGAASTSGYGGAASNSAYGGAAFSHAYGGKVMCEGNGQALYCTEFADDGSIASVACGVTGKKGIKAGTWYRCKGGKLVLA